MNKRKRVPSVLVDCHDCGDTFEIDARTFDLAVERSTNHVARFLCDNCKEAEA